MIETFTPLGIQDPDEFYRRGEWVPGREYFEPVIEDSAGAGEVTSDSPKKVDYDPDAYMIYGM